MKKQFVFMAVMASALQVSAQVKTEVRKFNLAGPYAVSMPYGMDTVNVKGEKFDEKSLLGNLSLSAEPTAVFSGQVLPSLKDSKSVGILTYYINNKDFVKGTVSVKGPKNYQLFIDDGHDASGGAHTLEETSLYGARPDRRQTGARHLAFCRREICGPGLSDNGPWRKQPLGL